MVIAIAAPAMGDWVTMAEPTTTTTRRIARCSKHAFAPSASFRPRNGGTGNVTLPGERHQTGLCRAGLASDSPEAGDDPVNETDPLGLWGWNPISDVSQAAGDVGHYVVTHKKGIEVGVGIGLGVLAAGTGVGALVEGSVLLASVSVAAGLGASALDYGPCVNGNDTAACVGLGLGLTGAVTGGFGLAGAGLVAAEIIAEDSTAAAILGGLGAFGWNVGIAGTIIDATTGIASASSLCSTTK
jgi:hypothetical protein